MIGASVGRASRGRCARAGAALVVLCTAGCALGLPRLVARGRFDEARTRAARARREPTGRSARARARALVAGGHVERARAVLLRDFRRQADLRSLEAAARLELDQGWDGSAALHLARLDTLDGAALRGDGRACALFERRAIAAVEIGDGALAWRDLARVDRLCPDAGPRRRALRARVIAAERALRPGARATHAQMLPGDGDGLVPRAATPQAVVAMLQREARGELGPVIVPDEALRMALAGRDWDWLAGAVQALAPGWAAYVRLRLGRVVSVPAPEVPAVSGVAAPDLARGLTPRDLDLGRVAAAQARGAVPVGAAVTNRRSAR